MVRHLHPQGGVDKVVCTCELLVGTSTFPQVIHNQSTGFPTWLSTWAEQGGRDQCPLLSGVTHRVWSNLWTSTTTAITGGPHDSHPFLPCGRLRRPCHPLDLGSAGDRPRCWGDERDLLDWLGPGFSDPVGPSAAHQVGEGPWLAPRVSSPLRGSEHLSDGGLDTPVSGPPSLCLLTGTPSSSSVAVRPGWVTRKCGATRGFGLSCRGVASHLLALCPVIPRGTTGTYVSHLH